MITLLPPTDPDAAEATRWAETVRRSNNHTATLTPVVRASLYRTTGAVRVNHIARLTGERVEDRPQPGERVDVLRAGRAS